MLGNVATPATAATLSVPPRRPPDGLVPIASVTVLVADAAVLPSASCSATWSAGTIALAAATFAGGWTMNFNCVGVAATAVALKVTGGPPTPATLARTVAAPGALPSV